MANLLFLAHRLPYPPNKGDKVRSYHLLKHLAARHRVFLGSFIDDPDDAQHLPALRALCAGLYVAPIRPLAARVRSLAALATGEPLTLRYYRDAGLRRWVAQTLASEPIHAALAFSSAMAPYAQDAAARPPTLVDLVDVDSDKWRHYAGEHRWPMSWLYRRESRRLLAHERQAVERAVRSFLVTGNEVALFDRLAPELAGRVDALGNGVDADYFAPDPERPSPYADGEQALVFTGAMDYWPNADAVGWFAREMLPALRRRRPALRLHVVGRNPTAEVRALAGDAVTVSGTVPDVRPWLQHAAVVVAPLRLARGLQNKVLEAMAMGRPVVAAASCALAIDAIDGRDLIAANAAEDHVRAVAALLDDPQRAEAMGRAARRRVLDDHSWAARLAPLDRHIADAAASAAPRPRPAPIATETACLPRH